MATGDKGWGRLALFGLSFVLLTIAGAFWALSSAQASLDGLRPLADLSIDALLLLLGLWVAVYITDVFRYRSLGKAVDVHVGNRAALDASVANFFFSWVTPGSTFGAPASIYMLGRRGIPWDAAVVIAFGKAFTGVALICFASLLLVGWGLGPQFDQRLLYLVFFGGSVFLLLISLLVLAALRPEAATRHVRAFLARLPRRDGHWIHSVEETTCSAIERLSRLRSLRALSLLALTHLLYFCAFCAVGVELIVIFGGEANTQAIATTVVYVAFTYIAPTPGGAGFAEAMALPFFGDVLPPESAVMMVLAYRSMTLAVQLCFGLPYLLVVGGIASAARGRATGGEPDAR